MPQAFIKLTPQGMKVLVEGQILKMVSGSERDAQVYNATSKKWEKTGGKEMWYECIFVSDDEFAEKSVFNTKKDLRKLEGQKVNLALNLAYDNFNGRMKLPALEDVIPVKKP